MYRWYESLEVFMYKENKLRKYIENSVKISISDNFKIRCSKDLLEKYNQGLYKQSLLDLK